MIVFIIVLLQRTWIFICMFKIKVSKYIIFDMIHAHNIATSMSKARSMSLLQRNMIANKIKYAYLSRNTYCIVIINCFYKIYSGMSLTYQPHLYNVNYGEEENNGKKLDIACHSRITVSCTRSRKSYYCSRPVRKST